MADQKNGTCGCDGPQHVMTLNQLDKVLKAQNEAVWKAVCHGKKYKNELAQLVATCLGQELNLSQRRINKVNAFNQILGVCDSVPTLVHIKVLMGAFSVCVCWQRMTIDDPKDVEIRRLKTEYAKLKYERDVLAQGNASWKRKYEALASEMLMRELKDQAIPFPAISEISELHELVGLDF